MRILSMVTAALLASACTLPELSGSHIQVRSATSSGPATGEDAYAAAKRQLALGNLGLAVDGFRKAVRENPNSADALNGLAVAYDRMGRFDLSRQAFEEALALAPSDRAIMHNLERSLLAQGRHAEAAQLAREMGEVTVPIAAPADLAQAEAPAIPTSRPESPMRIERTSPREVALITSGDKRNGWERAAGEPPIAEWPRTTQPEKRPIAVSRNGALNLPLPPASATAGPRLMVLNAVGRRGLARQMSGYLRERGWERTSIGDARTRRKTSFLIHAPKDRISAVLLSRTLPFRPRLVASTNARAMILLLGSNAVAFHERSRAAMKS